VFYELREPVDWHTVNPVYRPGTYSMGVSLGKIIPNFGKPQPFTKKPLPFKIIVFGRVFNRKINLIIPKNP
jgi:hypothetical protein